MRYIIYSFLILLAFTSSSFAIILQKGDIIHIESWPDIRYTRFVKIDNNGFLKIPYYNGKIEAEGKDIEDIDKLIKKKFKYKFPTIKFITTFSGNSSIKVSVVGAVFYPGEYIYPTGSRVSTIIKGLDMKKIKDNDKFQYASNYNDEVFNSNTLISTQNDIPTGKNLSPTRVSNYQKTESVNTYPKYNKKKTEKSFIYENVSYRNIQLIRNEKTTSIDLMKFFNNGSIKNNPIIEDGDVLVFKYIEKFASVKGAVNFPNTYEIKDGESLKDIVDLAGGAVPTAYFRGVEISNPKTKILKTVDYDSLKNIKVQNYDHIYVLFNKKERNVREIVLDGEVARPGIYPITDSTTLNEIIKRAGGLSQTADLFGIRITRHNDINVGPFKDIIKDYKSRIRISSMDKNAKDLKIYLNDGDEVFIPTKSKVVHVAGFIGKPGSYEWVKGKDAKYYLDLAGGENRFSYNNLIRVVKSKTGKILTISEVKNIEVGDLIYLPEYIEPTKRPGFLTFKEVIVVMGTMAALILNSFLIYQNASR